ncbi:membrane protein insertase YidC [Nocardioides marmoribigeumensis]|uniref:Membrane protein insertase YidC n=1 Tax=Nocardioides marmoribigeumensis TaxID=433649 RepID=A0ABU2BUM5_9ACTN|nr:membrane protein insertase YidC [Nocardioides marmoribigeumensis]MDR7362334.1 YidC/Oxa1 family membrane protein insertase [Nocardioides marmoribigeumensis]
MSALSAIGGAIMAPLYFLISLVLSGFHRVFGAVFGADAGITWVLSIIGLTLVVRASLIPLFVKQIKSSRNMQLIQPKVRELQKKYGHDRERLGQETMKLYKESGTNPFAACLPLIVQMPIFIALFRTIDRAAHGIAKGVLTQDQADSLSQAKIFGAHIADTFTKASGDSAGQVKVLAAVLVIAMTATTFLTQRQLMTQNMPADALQGQYAQQQKMLLYVLPLVFAVGGIAFPIGVLIYWTTSNLWTMGQQFYVIRNNPAPGTPAEKAKAHRDAEKRKRKGLPPVEDGAPVADAASGTAAEPGQSRQQPKRQSRQQRKGAPPPKGGPKNPPKKKP